MEYLPIPHPVEHPGESDLFGILSAEGYVIVKYSQKKLKTKKEAIDTG